MAYILLITGRRERWRYRCHRSDDGNILIPLPLYKGLARAGVKDWFHQQPGSFRERFNPKLMPAHIIDRQTARYQQFITGLILESEKTGKAVIIPMRPPVRLIFVESES